MKNKLLLLLLSLSINASAQNWELNFGANLNNFYYIKDANYPYYSTSHTPKVGYNLNVGIDNVKYNDMRLRFTLGINRYNSGLQTSGGGNGGAHKVDGQVKKTILRLGFYPMNFAIRKHLNINIGPAFSLLINEKTEGTYEGWYLAPMSTYVEVSSTLNEYYESHHSRFYVGANIRIAYEIPLSEDFYLVPQYALYVGLTNEFTEFPNTTKSMQNMLGIGIKRKL